MTSCALLRILLVENYFILINKITQNIDKEYDFFLIEIPLIEIEGI